MKKLIVLVCVLVMSLCMNMSVFADDVISPQSTPVVTPGTDTDKSPQTGEDNLLIYLGAGVVVAAGLSVVAARKLKRD